MIDDLDRTFGKTVHIGLTGAVVTTFDSIVKKSVDTISVIGIVFCCIDTTLGSYAMCTSGTIVKCKTFNSITQLS